MDAREKRVMVTVLVTFAVGSLALMAIAAWWVDRYASVWWQALNAPDRARPIAIAPPLDADAVRSAPPPIDPAKAGAALRGNPAQFFGPDAYPADAVRAGAEGRTVAMLAVNAGGVPIGCTIAQSSGSRSLDAATCAIAIGRVRYLPVRDGQGRPIASTARLPVRWVLPH